jgi:hypothetical protein
MDNQEAKGDEKGGCCSKASKCCGGKTLAALALLLVGGLGGFAVGRCAKSCDVPSAAPVQTPAK